MKLRSLFKKSTTMVYPFLMIACLFLTTFIFLNSYEVVFSKDSKIPYINALGNVQIDKIVQSVLIDKDEKDLVIPEYSEEYIGNFGRPDILKIPKASIRLSLSKAIKRDNLWLTHSSGAQYIVFDKSKNGNIGSVLVFLRKDWRTVSNPLDISIGDNVFLDTEGEWRYMFRITEYTMTNNDEGYVLGESNNSRLLFVIEDSQNSLNHIYRADFVNIQNIER